VSEARDTVPQLFDVLIVVLAGVRGLTDDPRGEPFVSRDGVCEVGDVWSAIVGAAVEPTRRQLETVVPPHRNGRPACDRVHRGPAERRVENQCLDVGVES